MIVAPLYSRPPLLRPGGNGLPPFRVLRNLTKDHVFTLGYLFFFKSDVLTNTFSLGRGEGGGGQREERGVSVHKYSSFVHGGNSSQAGSKNTNQ
jgi:hypothetical protein